VNDSDAVIAAPERFRPNLQVICVLKKKGEEEDDHVASCYWSFLDFKTWPFDRFS
ncbi:hypothetical protein A2U01_0083217, partial [Trifolium medium]|nr:hypothetical protein [Trifolium medium]